MCNTSRPAISNSQLHIQEYYSTNLSEFGSTHSIRMSGSIYETLDPNGGIRLLILESAPDEAQISCRLISHNINLNPDYKALSYEWGPQTDQKPIALNGQEFHVGENLWWALWYLRKDGSVSRLWVDALCINQKDESERGHQVSMMGKIFRNAQVICWLGKGNDPKHVRAMEYICDLSSWQMLDHDEHQNGSSEGSSAKNHRPSIHAADKVSTPTPLPTYESLVGMSNQAAKSKRRIQPKAGVTSMIRDEHPYTRDVPLFSEMEAICSHSYWRRTWIIQEYVLGKSINIRLGPLEIRDKYFQDSAEALLLRRLSDGGVQMLDAFRIFNLREDRLKGHHLPLIKLVELSEKSSCQDLRDRIYAMIGLASDCQNDEIVPDYLKPLSEVYDDIVVRHFYPSDRDKYGHSWSTVQASCLIQRVLWKPSESLSGFLHDSLEGHDHDLDLLSIHGKSCGTVRELSLPQSGMWWAHPGLVKAISPAAIDNGTHNSSRGLSSILSWIWNLWSSEPGDEHTEFSDETGRTILKANMGGSLICYVPGCTQVGDRVCRFVNSSVVAVLRLSKTSTILIGRGMILNNVGDLNIFEEGFPTTQKVFTNVNRHKSMLSFDLTPTELKSLTAPHY
ncbi:heterokaryon incompatibility protein-domain-containing protein [Cadophora sp. MPI-SDFR-AT-0126]|nr:heterokaryon incompatibility protein-domain-containing protein [Leotiomycetes sp. MPI-SDFR-AT-0126]